MKQKLTKTFLILFFSSTWILLLLSTHSVYAQSCTPTSKPYALINVVGASTSGTIITKESETSWMNAGGTTNIVLSEGDYITYKVAASKSVTVGLSVADQDCSLATIGNGLYTRFDNKIYIYQDGASVYSTGVSYTANSLLKIKIEGGKVKYYIGETLLYQRTTSLSSSQLVVDFSMYDKESQIKELQVYKCCQHLDSDSDGVCDLEDEYPGHDNSVDVNQNGIPDSFEVASTYIEQSFGLRSGYTGITPPSTGTSLTITKNTTTAWGNAGGSTNLKISNGQYIQYRVKNNMNVMVGFSKTLRTTTDFGSIENSLYTRYDNYVYAYQGAVNRSGIIKSYTESSVFKIMFQGGRVKFYCDDKLIYVAATIYDLNDDLYVDFSLNSNNSQIVDLQFFTNCPNNTITLTSAAGTNTQTACSNNAITNITYATTGATNATFSVLPEGISGSFDSNSITISGITTATGTFPYTINLTGGCGTVSTSGTITINPTVEATFEQVGIIGNGTITYQLPTISSNGITGTWNPAIIEEGEQDYIFTPTTGQCSSPVTMPFMVLKPKMITAYDDDFTATAINGNTGGETASVFDNDGINFSESVTSTNATVALLGVTPSIASITIDADGIITIPSNTPDGTYSVDYQITSVACPLNHDTATAIIEVNSPSSARKAKPKQQELSDTIAVYPNPSTSIFTIDLTATKEEYTSVKVFNVVGQTIYQGNLMPKASNPIDLSNSPSGYYIARVWSTSMSKSFQLIKQ